MRFMVTPLTKVHHFALIIWFREKNVNRMDRVRMVVPQTDNRNQSDKRGKSSA